MLDQKEFTISGKQYLIQTLPASRGLHFAVRLGHIMSGAADGMGFADNIEDMPINIGASIAGVLKRLDAEATPAMIKALVTESVIKPDLKGDQFEIEFAGNYDALFELAEKIIDHNRLIEAVKKRLSAIIGPLSSGEAKPTKSTRSTSARSSSKSHRS